MLRNEARHWNGVSSEAKDYTAAAEEFRNFARSPRRRKNSNIFADINQQSRQRRHHENNGTQVEVKKDDRVMKVVIVAALMKLGHILLTGRPL